MKREDQLYKIIPDSETAVLLTTAPVLRYYTGDRASAGGVLLAWKGGYRFLSAWAAEKKAGLADLRAALPGGIKKLEAETGSLNIDDGRLIEEKLGLKIAGDKQLETRIYMQRRSKEPDEIVKLRQAQDITDRAFTDMLNFVRPGMTDRELQKLIADMLWKEGSQMTSFNHVLGCGPDTDNPHVRPTGRTAQRGDLIMVDIGANVDGYGSDMTRMIALGEVSEEKQMIYDIVRRAQAAGTAAVHAGAVCNEVDRAARDVIEKAGYGEFYPHGLGHPVGCGGWEGPRFNREDTSLVPANIVMTVEPGIYLPGKFGVRIEDMVLITEDGIDVLTHSSHDLVVV